MDDPILKLFRDKSQQEVARDYFIHYVMQHELCLSVENSKRYVLIPSWLAKNEPTGSYRQSLQTMTDWYWEKFPALAEDQILTFDSLYLYVPTLLSYLDEARQLWQKLHNNDEPPVYSEDGEFWNDLISILKQRSKHQHLILPYLQWRYGNRTIKSFPQHNLPPNPFTEERFSFNKRRDNNRLAERQQSLPRDRINRGNREDNRRRSTERQEGLTNEMNAEIKSAMTLLQNDDKQKGVTLKPVNSYYRRLQHKVVADLGFDSRSVNRGNNERAVRIARRTKKKRHQ